MSSSVDVTKPVSGTPTTASVRANFQAIKDEIEALQQNAVTAGAGLTGGGDVSSDPTINVGAGSGITVNADDIALDGTDNRNSDHSAISVTAGAGLIGGGAITGTITMNIGAGDGITVNADSIQFDTTWGDARYALASHVHAATAITSGEFASARISEASVTQHNSAIDAGKVDGYDIAVVASLPGSPDANTIYFVTA